MKTYNKIATVSCWLLMGLSLSSCELLGPREMAKLPLSPVAKEPLETHSDVVFKNLQNKPSLAETKKPKSELYPGTNRFVASEAPQHRRSVAKGAGTYSLNFDEADLGEVAKVILGDILKVNYVLSPKVSGKVTLQTTEPLSAEELLPTLEMVLRMNSAALVKDGRIYHIEPSADALFTSAIGAGQSGYQTRVIPVRNVAVQEIADIIKPLVQEKTILNVDAARNILVASGTADEIARVLDMVSTFDLDVMKGRSFGLFPLSHVDPETVIKELEGIFYKKGKAGEESEFFQFIPIERLNAVLAITHQARYLEDIDNWVTRLDKANTASGGGVNVYKVQHVDAEDLAGTLNEIFTGAAKKDKSAKVAPGTKAATITNKPQSRLSAAKAASSSNSGNAGTGDANVSNVGEVRIIADKANNSVVIVATAREYEVILPVIKQLDVMPLMVLIDATVVEVALTDTLKYGISWYLSHGDDAIGGNKAGATALGTAIAAAAAASTGGLSAVYSSGSVKALLNAEASKNNINVISSPSLMVLNNQKASIDVGDKVPLLGSVTGSTGSGGTGTGTGTLIAASSNNITYEETGVKLEVTPRVNANGIVIMEIFQSVSEPKDTTIGDGQKTSQISTRKIESFVAINDGETLVLGGLIKETLKDNTNGIPFLYELPWIGSLFGGTDKTNNRTELVVLITPRVIKNRQDARLISNEFRRKLTGIYQDTTTDAYGAPLEETRVP
ncbi:MAG: type II secretion system secretin GspD [Methylococcales bacterium]|nr:type II secretion system secretin GspD [Methylococcales bacterium]